MDHLERSFTTRYGFTDSFQIDKDLETSLADNQNQSVDPIGGLDGRVDDRAGGRNRVSKFGRLLRQARDEKEFPIAIDFDHESSASGRSSRLAQCHRP
jgi:hypothetical protein